MKKAFAIMIALCVILILAAVTITGCAESPEPEHAGPQQEHLSNPIPLILAESVS